VQGGALDLEEGPQEERKEPPQRASDGLVKGQGDYEEEATRVVALGEAA